MPDCLRYTCQAVMLPVIEGALAANGYEIEVPPRECFSGAITMVMQCGTTTVLLEHTPDSEVGEIEVWGAGQTDAADILESQHLTLHKQPALSATDT